MKHISRILSLLIITSAVVFFNACDGGDDSGPSEKEQQIEKLVGTWNATTVTLDGTPDTRFANFKLTITKASGDAMTWTAAGRPNPSPWDASGSFTFGTPVATQLVRDDGITISYAADGNSLTMTIPNYTGQPYSARVSSVSGTWVFNMTK